MKFHVLLKLGIFLSWKFHVLSMWNEIGCFFLGENWKSVLWLKIRFMYFSWMFHIINSSDTSSDLIYLWEMKYAIWDKCMSENAYPQNRNKALSIEFYDCNSRGENHQSFNLHEKNMTLTTPWKHHLLPIKYCSWNHHEDKNTISTPEGRVSLVFVMIVVYIII